MKKIDDSKLYFYFAIITLTLSVFLGALSYYSILSVESRASELLSAKENTSDSYKKAYLLLREPQIFARYEHFDTEQDLQMSLAAARRYELETKKDLTSILANTFPGTTVMKAIRYFDRKIYSGKSIEPDEKRYLEVLLDRREKGSRLGRNTMVFTLALSFVSWLLFFYEKRKQ